jgi:hypothetical protein
MNGGSTLFELVPIYVRRILQERIWADQRNIEGVPFRSFKEFVEHRLWEGLNTTIKDLMIFCRNAPDVVELILQEVPSAAEYGGDRRSEQAKADQVDNVNLIEGGGNSAVYALSRLKRDRPDLAEKVVAGEMSANAAAIEAGFRKKKIEIPDDEEEAAEFLVKRWGSQRAVRLADLIKLLV